MDLYELVALALLVGGIWLWLDSLKAREIGIRAAQAACAEEGLQLLDETVLSKAFSLARDDEGRLRFRRIYAFEYSDTGDNRRFGSVTMLGHVVEFLHVRANLYVVPPTTATPNSHETLH